MDVQAIFEAEVTIRATDMAEETVVVVSDAGTKVSRGRSRVDVIIAEKLNIPVRIARI